MGINNTLKVAMGAPDSSDLMRGVFCGSWENLAKNPVVWHLLGLIKSHGDTAMLSPISRIPTI